jgi:hypothetical protein
MAVPMESGATLRPGRPQPLFTLPLKVEFGIDQYDAAPDGRRFLVLAEPPESKPPVVHVLVNWTALLKKP